MAHLRRDFLEEIEEVFQPRTHPLQVCPRNLPIPLQRTQRRLARCVRLGLWLRLLQSTGE